jgi:hypothetical protein
MPGLETKLEERGQAEPATPINVDQTADASQSGSSPIDIQITRDPNLFQMLLDTVLDDYERAKSDKEKVDYGTTSKGEKLNFKEWYKRIIDMYNGNRIPKDVPWKFCSNRSIRIATSVVDLIHARLFPSVWNEDLTRWRAMASVYVPKTERISKFMDWWVRVWSPMRPFFDFWTKHTASIGDSLTETYWDVEVNHTTEELDVLGPDGQPVGAGKTKVPKQIKVEKTKSRVIPKDSVFFLKHSRDIQKDPVIIREEVPFRILEELELSGAIINLDELRTKIIVPGIPENADPSERERLRRIKIRNIPVEVVREYMHYDVDGVGTPESVRVWVSPEHRVYLGGIRMRDVTKSGKRPLDLTKYDNYLQRPDDLEGEGVLTKVRELAEEVDAIFNQMTDANTLGVLRPFFYDPSGDVDAPAIKLGPNKGMPVTDPNRNVYFPPLDIPTERLINAIRLTLEFIERLTAASEYVMGRESGTVGGSGTATRTQAIVQSAEIRFSLPSERLRFGASRIVQQHLDIIQLNIPIGMEEKVLGEKGEKIFSDGELSAQGINGEFTAFQLADPSMGSKETERQLMGMMYSILMQNVLVGTDPVKIYTVTADFLKAYGRDPERYLGPAPMTDDVTDPEDENTLMLNGDFSRVIPQMAENHLFHIHKHLEFAKSPHFLELQQTAPELTNQIMEYNKLHVEQHFAMLQQMMALMAKVGGGSVSAGLPDKGGQGASEKPGQQPSVENVSGPMGEALDKKREGEVGKPSHP